MILPVQQSIMLITLGSLTCGEGGNLSTRDLGFIYVSSAGRIGCVFIHPTQPTDAPSSRRSSRSHFYTPGFPRGFQRFKYWITEDESIRNTGSRPIKFIAGVLGLGLWCLTPQASTLTFVRLFGTSENIHRTSRYCITVVRWDKWKNQRFPNVPVWRTNLFPLV
jgi:hypothetical protein